jgi:hypothetical protein
MKKPLLLVLLLSIFLNSCSSDDNEYYDVNVEFLSNSADSPVYIEGNGINGKYIKNLHKESVTLRHNAEYVFTASCENEKALLSIKIFNTKGQLIEEASGNQWVIIREPSK